MRISIAWGREQLELDLREENLVAVERAPIAANLSDPAQALRHALEHPFEYPALRLALTPDDRVAIAVDERIPHLGQLLVVLLEHLQQAHVKSDAITLLCSPPSTGQAWVEELPDEFQDVRVEVHQPGDRRKLAYLAVTKDERRVYLNRTAVDADQLVLLTRRAYDPVLGHGGAETFLFPGLGDEATLQEFATQLDSRPPTRQPWPVQQAAREVAWLLGVPFFVQIIAGAGDGVANIVAGPLESSNEGERLLDARWRVEAATPADVVIASITGERATLDDLARAFFAATRVVRPGGSIVLLSEGTPTFGPSFERFRHHDDPAEALRHLLEEKPSDVAAGFMWATAAEHAKLYLLTGLSHEVTEELFAIPLQHAQQAQKLLTDRATCLLLPDAHRTLAVLR
jgi:nickel-dependent lactate racemase